jgi:hypothetical protein
MGRLTDEQCSLLGKMRSLFPAKNTLPDALEKAYALGMIRKESLQDGSYYAGSCRNAEVARWSKTKNCFVYMRTKFYDVFAEPICHPADDNGFDLFFPLIKVEDPTIDEKVKPTHIWNWAF